eukprot:EG_transcript_16188
MASATEGVCRLLCAYYGDPARVAAHLPEATRRKQVASPKTPPLARPPWDDTKQVPPTPSSAPSPSEPRKPVQRGSPAAEGGTAGRRAEATVAVPGSCSLRACAVKRRPDSKRSTRRPRSATPIAHAASPTRCPRRKPPLPDCRRRKKSSDLFPDCPEDPKEPATAPSTASLPSRLKSRVYESRSVSASADASNLHSTASHCTTERTSWEADRWAWEQAWRHEADQLAFEAASQQMSATPSRRLPRRVRRGRSPRRARTAAEAGDPPAVQRLLLEADHARCVVECAERCLRLRAAAGWWFGVLAVHRAQDEQQLMAAEDRFSRAREAADRQRLRRDRRRWRRVQEERSRRLMRLHDAAPQ